MSPLSERGISPQDDYDPDRRALVRNISVLLGVAGTAPALLVCSPRQVGETAEAGVAGTVAGTLQEAIANTQERDVSKLSPRIIWRGEFKHAKDYLEDLFWTGEVSFGGEEVSGVVVARDYTTGAPLWHKEGVQRNLGVDFERGWVYFLVGGQFVAFDEKTGERRWAQPFPGLKTAGAGARAGDHAIVTFSLDGVHFLQAFNRRDGKSNFTHPINAPKYFATEERFIKNRGTLYEEDGKGNVVRISSIDLTNGETQSREFEVGWNIESYFGKNLIVLRNREAESIIAVSKGSLEVVWRKDNATLRQSYYDYAVIEDLGRRVYKIVDERGRVSDWEADAKNAYMWIAGPSVVGEPKDARYWFWRDYTQAWVQLIDMSSGKPKWESREFHATQDLNEFAGGIGICVGQFDDKRDQLIAVDMGNGHIKWTKELNWVKEDSRFIGGDFGMVTYIMSGIKYYLNPQNGDLITTLDIGSGFGSGGAGEKIGFHYAFDEPNSLRKVVVTGV